MVLAIAYALSDVFGRPSHDIFQWWCGRVKVWGWGLGCHHRISALQPVGVESDWSWWMLLSVGVLSTSIGNVYIVTLQHYQLMAGLLQSILKDTWPLPWISGQWIDQLQQFLHETQGTIEANPWLPLPWQENDHGIMDDVLDMQVPKQQAQQIQHVQLFLCITMLSEFMDHQGTHILPAMLYPAPVASQTQQYHQSTSLLQWPHHHAPGPAAWKAWQDFIKNKLRFLVLSLEA